MVSTGWCYRPVRSPCALETEKAPWGATLAARAAVGRSNGGGLLISCEARIAKVTLQITRELEGARLHPREARSGGRMRQRARKNKCGTATAGWGWEVGRGRLGGRVTGSVRAYTNIRLEIRWPLANRSNSAQTSIPRPRPRYSAGRDHCLLSCELSGRLDKHALPSASSPPPPPPPPPQPPRPPSGRDFCADWNSRCRAVYRVNRRVWV